MLPQSPRPTTTTHTLTHSIPFPLPLGKLNLMGTQSSEGVYSMFTHHLEVHA